MITDVAVVHAAFFAVFGEKITVKSNGKNVDVPVVYANLSSVNFSEGRKEAYPVVTIQDLAPEDDEQRWSISGDLGIDNIRDTDNDGVYDTADLVGDPLLLLFRYEVAQACNNFFDSTALYTWFISTFPRWHSLEIDGRKYSLKRISTKVERSDGIFEYNHAFDLAVWFEGTRTKDVPLVQKTENFTAPKQF